MFNHLYAHSKRRSRIRQEFWFILLILYPLIGHTAPVLEVSGYAHSSEGFGSRYQSQSSSSYFNPAALDLSKSRVQLSIRSWFRTHQIDRYNRPHGYDIPAEVFEARVLDDQQLIPLEFRPLPTSEVDQISQQLDQSRSEFLVVSVSQPIIRDRFAVGILTVLPMGSFQEQVPYFVDERAQFFDNRLHFEHYSNKFGSLVLVASTSLKLVDGVQIGGGITLSNHSKAKPGVFVSDAARTESSLTLSRVKVTSVFAPHIGIQLDVTDQWKLTGNLHFPYQSSVKGESRLRFWDQGRQDEMKPPVAFEFVYDYLPLRASFGQEYTYEFSDVNLRFSGGITWYQWSKYTDRIGDEPVGFSDTIAPELKVEVSTMHHLAYLSGRYTPSSVPEQDGRTNYVDNDQIACDIGYQFTTYVGTSAYRMGTSIQMYQLRTREHQKRSTSGQPIVDELPDAVSIQDRQPIEGSAGLQTNNPGFPGFRSKGMGLMLGVMVGVDYE